jgi:hypothetical protein
VRHDQRRGHVQRDEVLVHMQRRPQRLQAASAPDSDGCECPTPGCCGTGCQSSKYARGKGNLRLQRRSAGSLHRSPLTAPGPRRDSLRSSRACCREPADARFVGKPRASVTP